MFPPNRCFGCGACAHLCPTQAIKLESDEGGFFYPVVNEDKCVNCGLCRKKCPILTPPPNLSHKPEAYASQNRDERVRSCSSSGGIFSLLAEHVINLGGVVVGCAMNESCYVAEHRAITCAGDLHELRGSKYLQSRADHVFPIVKEALNNQRWVIFSGTPCQVLGLHSYLSDVNTERLISIDIICHGAPSPAVWEKYVRYFETIKDSKVVSVQFRNKEKGWSPYSLVLNFENGEVYSEACTKDLYCRGFIADCFLRRSCYNCIAKGGLRAADITLGDLWGIRYVCPSMDDNRGTSLVLLNTIKGETLFREISADTEWQRVDFDEAVKHNPSYSSSSARIAYRNHFMKRIHKKNIVMLLEEYLDMHLTSRIKRKLIGIFCR